jgi:hypothetical protein
MMAVPFKTQLLVSLALFLASAQYFAYAAYVVPRNRAAGQLEQLNAALAADTRPVPQDERPAQKSSATVPELLARVQELALATNVEVAGVEPQNGNPAQFRMTVKSGYGGLLLFLGRFESLQVSITGFELLPGDHGGRVQATVDFTHSNAAPAVNARTLAGFEAQLRSTALLDPFNPDAGVIAFAPDRDPNDLTWMLHLTSISEIGDTRYATIDGEEFKVGDKVGARVVRDIGDGVVTLIETDGKGERRLVLRFRELIADGT